MKASIVIPTLNRQKILTETLKYLLKQRDDILEIILVDQSDEIDKDFFAYVKGEKLIKYFHIDRKNTPGARNYGVKKASGEIIIFLDDDIIPASDLVRKHLANFEDKNIQGITGRVISPEEKGVWTTGRANWITKTGNVIPNWTSKDRAEANTVAGGNCSFRKELIEKVGYFDDSYIGNAMREESDFAQKFVRAGYKIIFDPKAEIIHLSYSSGGSRMKSRIDWYFDFFRNEYYFFLKYFSHWFIPLFFLRKLRAVLSCMFYYGKGSKKALQTPFRGFKRARKDYEKFLRSEQE